MKVQFVGIWRGCVCHPLTAHTHSIKEDTFPPTHQRKEENARKLSGWNASGQFAAGRSRHSSVLKITAGHLQHSYSPMLASHFWSCSTLSAVSKFIYVSWKPSDKFLSPINHKLWYLGAYMFKFIENEQGQTIKEKSVDGRKTTAEDLWRRVSKVNVFNEKEFSDV